MNIQDIADNDSQSQSARLSPHPEFFGEGSERLFGCMHLPDVARGVGVVICSSLYAESLSNYRAEVELSRELARRGVAVQRFHYRGTGHSDGSERDITYASLCRDAGEAAARLAEKATLEKIAFVGTRWGALVAAASSRERSAPLALWEPALDPARYFREVNRFRLAHEMQKGIESNQEGLEDGLARKGFFDILGYRIDKTLYDSALGHTLSEEIGPDPRSVLLVQLARKRELRPQYAKFVGSLNERGFDVETNALQDDPVWWLLRPPLRSLDDLVQSTALWLSDHLDDGEIG
jgi:pimeloyl-ACP methyl ester carboxylesterase